MKQMVAIALVLLLTLSLLPLLLLGEEPLAGPSQPPAATDTLPIDRTVVTPDRTADSRVQVRMTLEDGEMLTLPLDKYLWRVMAVEMPASFEPEALKVQTVAARTYTLSKMKHTVEAHPDADVCTDIICRQVYIGPADAAANWEKNAQTCTDKIATAMADTNGMAALFQGQPIRAVLFSSAAGRTVDAAEMWGNAVSYLTSVNSLERDKVPNYHFTIMVSLDKFKSKLLAQCPQADLSGELAGWSAGLVPNSAGGVETVDIDGTAVDGGSLYTLFGLRSIGFTVSASADGVTFSVTGYSHGVGMSQYGANALAKGGKSCDKISKWYYIGIDVAPYTPQR